MKNTKLPETVTQFLGIALGARGIEAARGYAAALGDNEPFSQFNCLKHVADQLNLSNAEQAQLISGMLSREDDTATRVAKLERGAEEAKRIEDRLASLEERMAEILSEVQRIEDEKRQLLSELQSLAAALENPE